MTIFVTSDQHWFHKNIIKYCDRPFQSVEQMNYEMIKRWNFVVKPYDTVIHLGDFALVGHNYNKLKWLRYQLHGKIRLMRGNHDKSPLRQFKSARISIIPCNTYTYKNLIFSHRPLDIVPEKFVNVHGHIHEKKSYGRRINVSVDVSNFKPQRLSMVLWKARLYSLLKNDISKMNNYQFVV